MKIEQYDSVRLKDGREGCVVEKFGESDFLVDIGSSPKDWDTIYVSLGEIEAVINS